MTKFFGTLNLLKKCASKLKFCVQIGCITYCVFEYIGEFVVTSGPSMEPTIFTNDVLLTQSISRYHLYLIKKGDIVIARSPVNPKKYVCKRVTGLPGDKIKQPRNFSVVPKGHVWLEGDNSKNSTDSRLYGPVPQGLIRGKAIFRIWPLQHAGTLLPNERGLT